MSATKQYVRTRTAQGPSQPAAVPIVLTTPQAPGSRAIPVLFQQSNDAALQVAYNNSVPAQHFALSPTLLQQQSPTSDSNSHPSPPGPAGRESGGASTQPAQAYTAYAPLTHSPTHLSTSPSATGDAVNYGMVQYVTLPTTGTSPVGSVPVHSLLSSQFQAVPTIRQSPTGAPSSHVDSFPGFEYRQGYHGRERKTSRHKGSPFDPFEDSDTDQSPIHAMRPRGYSHTNGGSRAMDYSKSMPNAGMEMHYGHARNRSGHHGRPTQKTLDTDDEEDQAHGSSPRSVLSSLFRRAKPRNHRDDNNTLTVPGSTHPRTRQHRQSVGAYDAAPIGLGSQDRSRAMSSSHHNRPSHDEIYSRSPGPQQIPHRPGVHRAKSDSRYRRRSSMSDTESDSDTETADERSRHRIRSRSRHSSHRHSHGDGHASFHREALIGSLTAASERETREAKRRQFEAGRRAGEEEGRRRAEEEVRRFAEMKERVAKRSRGAGAMGGGA